MSQINEKAPIGEAENVVVQYHNNLLLSLILYPLASRIVSVILFSAAIFVEIRSVLTVVVISVAAMLFAFTWQAGVKTVRSQLEKLEDLVIGIEETGYKSKWRDVYIGMKYQEWKSKNAMRVFIASEPFSWFFLTTAAALTKFLI